MLVVELYSLLVLNAASVDVVEIVVLFHAAVKLSLAAVEDVFSHYLIRIHSPCPHQ
jgi:hypothetical protein